MKRIAFFSLANLLIVLFAAQTLFADTVQEKRLKKFPVIEPAKQMVENFLLPQDGLKNPAVIDVMKRIPRHRFVLPEHQQAAYWDQAIAIGNAQTISPPYIVAYMTEQLDPKPTDKVLEIGTGSGYQAAVLSLLVDQVYSIEIVEPLGKRAETLLKQLGCDNVRVRIGDGYKGWKQVAPFDSIIVTCSPESVPQPLIDQLKEGGRMIIPVGERHQQAFYLCKKINGKLVKERQSQVLFVPMTGEAEDQRQDKSDDGAKPQLVGGDFKVIQKDGSPKGWHYARGVTFIEADKKFGDVQIVRFTKRRLAQNQNQNPPDQVSLSQMLQGFAVDGRAVKMLNIEYFLRGKDVVATYGPVMTPTAVLTLFNENREQVAELPLGRCVGTFGWKKVSYDFPIPPETREAVLLIGLPIASGQIDIRNIAVKNSGKQ
ncbi:hypothetical protein FACS189454_02100 [Planctomycetales bacterium]|nr:hypothetical protein FACS189454_02100 [Planctomycetales bacterium]